MRKISIDSERRTIAPQSADFRLYLQNELLERCRKNPAYSLRAFAKSLECDFSTLSKILKGTRPVGRITIQKFSARLGLNPAETSRFILNSKPLLKQEIEPDYGQLTVDSFKIISDWQHYAILELMRLDHFKPDKNWIAKKLGLSVNEVSIAVERLQRVEILEITPAGKWIDHSNGKSTTIGHHFTNSAFRNLQRQVLEMALKALEQVPIEKRDQSSMTMAIDTRKIPEAKLKIKKFRREMATLLSRGDSRDEVYQLSVSLFPILGGKS